MGSTDPSGLHFAPQSQAGHLPVSVRRSVASTCSTTSRRSSYTTARNSGFHPDGPARHWNDQRPEVPSRCVALYVQLAAIRANLERGWRTAAQHGTDLGSALLCPIDVDGEPSTMIRRVSHIQTGHQQAGRPARRSSAPTASGRRTSGCQPLSSSSHRAAGNKTG